MRIVLIILFVFCETILFADGLKEGFEVDNQLIFNGASELFWIGDTSDFKITTAHWPYGSNPDFTGSHSLRSQSGSILNSTILTDISEVYKSTLRMRWEIFVSGSSASITISKGFAVILYVDSHEVDSVELGKTKGYRIRLADPSGTAYPDGLYFEKADGINWTIIDSVHTGSANINQGWKIVVERNTSGEWVWGYKNGLISNTVSLNDTVIDNEFTEGKYSGIHWYSIASDAGDFGCDEFIVNPYTPGLWKSDASSTDWNASLNWDNEIIPDVNTDVLITPGAIQPELSENVNCNNLILDPGSGLIIKTGSSININGDLRLKSDSSGNASIIDHGSLNVDGNKTIEYYLNYSSGDSTEYHFFSSPMTPQNIENYFENFFVYSYNETLASWYSLSSGNQLEIGKGYSVYNSINKDTLICFEGEFNSGDVQISLSNSNDKWNLVGNPFPSTIDWDLIDKSSIESTVYMWNPKTLSYSYYNNGVGVNLNNEGLIASMQAFFVRAKENGQLTIFQNSRCISQSQLPLKISEKPSPIIKLSLVSGQFKDEAVIRFQDGSKTEFDVDFDALKLLSEHSVPQIYSIYSEDDRMLSINTLPQFIDSCEVKIGIWVQKNKKYSIQIEELFGFDSYTIYLEDIDNESQIRLNRNDTIWFISKATEQRNLKLKIKKKKKITALENLIRNAYQKDGFIVISFRNELVGDAILEIYSLEGRRQGRTVCKKGQGGIKIPIPKTSGIYIIRLSAEGINHSKKINTKN